jgi:multicomponent Na+:H+ antiporter subunit G
MIVELLASAMLVLGSSLGVISAIGLHRFRDIFARMHAATKPATLGLAMVVGGAILVLPTAGPIAKLSLVLMLQFTTAPIAAHLVGRATYQTGTELDPRTVIDEE